MALFRRIFSYRPLQLVEQQTVLTLANDFRRTPHLHKYFADEALLMIQNRNDSLLFAHYLYGNLFQNNVYDYRIFVRTPFIYNALGQELDYHKSDYKVFPMYAGKHVLDTWIPNNVKTSDLLILEELR
jgi:hypothetical protein